MIFYDFPTINSLANRTRRAFRLGNDPSDPGPVYLSYSRISCGWLAVQKITKITRSTLSDVLEKGVRLTINLA